MKNEIIIDFPNEHGGANVRISKSLTEAQALVLLDLAKDTLRNDIVKGLAKTGTQQHQPVTKGGVIE